MRHFTAIVTAVLVVCLGFAGVGIAQAQQVVQVQGTIQAVNCSAQQLTLKTSGGSTTFQATNQTVVDLNGAATQLCALQSYLGAAATASVASSGNAFVLDHVTVTAPQAAGMSRTATIAGIAIGALVLGGLAYLAIHNAAAAANTPPPATFSSWDDAHNAWTANCNAVPDQQGYWGHQRSWDGWCQQNQQYQYQTDRNPSDQPTESKQSA